jgi:hypothetical protein
MALKIQHNFGQAYVHAYYRQCEERWWLLWVEDGF